MLVKGQTMENIIEEHAIECSVPEELKTALRERMSDMTMLPSLATKAIALTNDPNADAKQFADLVDQDITLAMKILSVANIPIFSGGKPISNLQQAVVRLGFKMCRNLVISSSATCLVEKMTLSDEWIREVIWQHSFKTASLATVLDRALRLGFGGEEFAAGLLHDFGRLLLAVVTQEQYVEFDSLEFLEDNESIVREVKAVGTDHCRFGAWFATNAGLPENLIEVIRSHHSLDPFARHSKLVSLVITADHMANHLQRREVVSDYSAASNPGIHQLAQHYGESLIRQFEDQAKTLLLEVET